LKSLAEKYSDIYGYSIRIRYGDVLLCLIENKEGEIVFQYRYNELIEYFKRTKLADEYEYYLLDEKYIDSKVSITGDNWQIIKVESLLMGRVMAHELMKDLTTKHGGFYKKLKQAGLEEITFTDGRAENHSYELE
jgi:hypothetical protein